MKIFIRIAKPLSIVSMFVALLIAYDCIFPGEETDTAIISRKTNDFHIQAQGKYFYNEGVNKSFYEKAQKGDTIVVILSRFFKEWKSIGLLHNGKLESKVIGTDIYYMAIMGFAFLIPLLSFKSIEFLSSKRVLLIAIAVLEFIACMVLIKFFLVWIGWFDKI